MCSFNASPLPTPSPKRPGSIAVAVAPAWATIAGWMRIVGQVTPVTTSIRCVTWATPPITAQTNGLFPCRSTQGWKWSEIERKSKPTSSARRANRTSSFGPNSSLESV
jgi:hypothetical protein